MMVLNDIDHIALVINFLIFYKEIIFGTIIFYKNLSDLALNKGLTISL